MFKKPILDATMKALKTERDKAQKELDGIASMEQKKAELTEAVAALDKAIKPICKELSDIEKAAKKIEQEAELEKQLQAEQDAANSGLQD